MIQYANWFNNELASNIPDADLVIFTGGTDINPDIYGKKAHNNTQRPDFARDSREMSAFDLCIQLDKPMLGICRGAQLLCALNGGILVQDCNGHNGSMCNRHAMKTSDGLILMTSSDHHQRAFPWVEGCEFELFAWSNGRSVYSEGEGFNDRLVSPERQEAEVVHYPKTRSLGIQGHPEWQMPFKDQEDEKAVKYFRQLVSKLLAKTL